MAGSRRRRAGTQRTPRNVGVGNTARRRRATLPPPPCGPAPSGAPPALHCATGPSSSASGASASMTERVARTSARLARCGPRTAWPERAPCK
eukprot:10081482-Lingulodinium_polyedra.AAC.1